MSNRYVLNFNFQIFSHGLFDALRLVIHDCYFNDLASNHPLVEPLSEQNTSIAQDIVQTGQSNETGATNAASNANGIDPTFLEALPADLRAEVLASQQSQSAPAPVSAPAPTPTPLTTEEFDPEILAALPPDIQAEVLAQQRAQRVAHQAEGQPVDMDIG